MKKTAVAVAGALAVAAELASASLPGGHSRTELAGGSPQGTAKLYNLRWNPEISSFTDEEFREGFRLLNRQHSTGLGFDWSIYEPEELQVGDWCVFTRVGSNNVNGVVGIGRFTTRAYEGESWRGDGKRIAYAELEILCFQEPAETGLWTADELERAVPEEDWRQGHAGVVIEGEAAEKLVGILVRGLAEIRRYNTRKLAVRRHPGGARSLANGMLSHLCPKLLAALEEGGGAVAGEAYWPKVEEGDCIFVDFRKLRAGKSLEESVKLLEWGGGQEATEQQEK